MIEISFKSFYKMKIIYFKICCTQPHYTLTRLDTLWDCIKFIISEVTLRID